MIVPSFSQITSGQNPDPKAKPAASTSKPGHDRSSASFEMILARESDHADRENAATKLARDAKFAPDADEPAEAAQADEEQIEDAGDALSSENEAADGHLGFDAEAAENTETAVNQMAYGEDDQPDLGIGRDATNSTGVDTAAFARSDRNRVASGPSMTVEALGAEISHRPATPAGAAGLPHDGADAGRPLSGMMGMPPNIERQPVQSAASTNISEGIANRPTPAGQTQPGDQSLGAVLNTSSDTESMRLKPATAQSQVQAGVSAELPQNTPPPASNPRAVSIPHPAAAQDEPPSERRRAETELRLANAATFTGQAAQAQPPVPTPMQAVSAPTLLPLADEVRAAERVRWISEIGFTTEIGATDMPSTLRQLNTALLQQPELPRHVMAQVAEAMRQGGPDRPIELTLSPVELGRVRISMQTTDGTMTVQVLADRPETLDLMRRHVDLLAQEFLDIGYGSANFSFGENAADAQDGQGNHTHGTQLSDTPQPDGPAAPPQLAIHTDRVDIRI